jgi:hypothetical protein
MKKITIIAIGCLLTLNLALAGDPSPADQKWLGAVEKMVSEGQTKISTPSEDRKNLLQEWADKHSYSATVTKNDSGYQIELSKGLAKN